MFRTFGNPTSYPPKIHLEPAPKRSESAIWYETDNSTLSPPVRAPKMLPHGPPRRPQNRRQTLHKSMKDRLRNGEAYWISFFCDLQRYSPPICTLFLIQFGCGLALARDKAKPKKIAPLLCENLIVDVHWPCNIVQKSMPKRLQNLDYLGYPLGTPKNTIFDVKTSPRWLPNFHFFSKIVLNF